MRESHQETSGASPFLKEGRRIFPTGARHGMDYRKLELKNLKAIAFSKTLGAKIILKLKSWAQTLCNFESHLFESHQHQLKPRQLEPRRFK